MSKRLWPPAAATSSARLADGCPRTSARSPAASGAAASSAAASTVVGCFTASPRRCATASASVSTPKTGGPPASAASGALTAGTMRAPSAARLAAAAMGSAPRTPWTRPSMPRRAPERTRASMGSPCPCRPAGAIDRSGISSGNPNAVSEAGAVGLTQLMPVAIRQYAREAARLLGRPVNARSALDNLLMGAFYYRDALRRTHGNVEAAARLYHGGPNLAMHGPRTMAYGKAIVWRYRQMTSESVRPAV